MSKFIGDKVSKRKLMLNENMHALSEKQWKPLNGQEKWTKKGLKRT